MLYAAETWPVRARDVEKLERTQYRMLRWVTGANSWERRTNKSVREAFGLESIDQILRR